MLKLNNIIELIDYFQSIAANYRLIEEFVFGGNEQLTHVQRRDASYPMLWLDVPEKWFGGDENIIKKYSVELMVIVNEKKDTPNYRQNLFVTEKIIEQIIFRLVEDFSLNLETVKCMPVQGFTGDHLYGWKLFSVIDIHGEICFDEENWIVEEE